jgi:DNA-binding GntR family transcriptional regulator
VPRRPEIPYLTVAAALRERIDSGEWLPGEALPGVVALAGEYGVGKSTVARAVKILVGEGRLYTVRGWGTFVAEKR